MHHRAATSTTTTTTNVDSKTPTNLRSEKDEENFDPSLVSPQLAMIKKLSVKPKTVDDDDDDDGTGEKDDPKSPLAMMNDGQTSVSHSSTDISNVSFQEKKVVDDKEDAKNSNDKNNNNNKQQNNSYVKPRPIWIARLPRPSVEKYDEQKAQREKDQQLDQKIKKMTFDIDTMIRESQELKVELDAKRVELKKSRDEVRMANDLVKPIRDRWNGLRDAEKSVKEKSQDLKGLDSTAKLDQKLDDLEKRMEDEGLSVLEQNKILREQKKLRNMQSDIESLEERKRQTTGQNLVGESRDDLKARLSACSEAIEVLKARLKTVSDSHDETFEQTKTISESIKSLREKRSKLMDERHSKYRDMGDIRKEIQVFSKFKALARESQASMDSKNVDAVSDARMKCEDHNDKLIAQMIEGETYREWYMLESRKEQANARDRKLEVQAAKDSERLAKIEEKLKFSEAKRVAAEKEKMKAEEEIVSAVIPNTAKLTISTISTGETASAFFSAASDKKSKKQNTAKKSPSSIDNLKSLNVEAPKIAEVPEHILEILNTKKNDDSSDAPLTPRSQAREKSIEGAQLKARKQQLKEEKLKASAQKAEKILHTSKNKNDDLAAANAAIQAAKEAKIMAESNSKKLEEREMLSSAASGIEVARNQRDVVRAAIAANKKASEKKTQMRKRSKEVSSKMFAALIVGVFLAFWFMLLIQHYYK